MLDMFKRPGDPVEYNYLYALPGGALLAAVAVASLIGFDQVTNMSYLASAAFCIASIACLSKQESARTGNALGMLGVSTGIATTLGILDIPILAYG